MTLASEIVKSGAYKVLERDPNRVDDAFVNTVIKQGANALESAAAKGEVDPAVGSAAEVPHPAITPTPSDILLAPLGDCDQCQCQCQCQCDC